MSVNINKNIESEKTSLKDRIIDTIEWIIAYLLGFLCITGFILFVSSLESIIDLLIG